MYTLRSSAAEPNCMPPPSAPVFRPGPAPTTSRQRTAPFRSGSSPQPTPDFCPIVRMSFPFGSRRRITDWPKSTSGPSASGQLIEGFVGRTSLQPKMNASFAVACQTHTFRPVFRSTAMTALLAGAAGSLYELPVAK